jgi:Flp pilus assembly protein TadD
MPAGIQEEEVRRAIDQARHQVLDQPHAADAWGHLGKVLLAHLFSDEADFCFAQAARLDPANRLWPYARGLIVVKTAPEKGVPLLRQAIAGGGAPSEERAAMSMQLAEVLLENGDLDEAETLFRQEQEVVPNSPRATFGLGLIARARGDEAAAARLLLVARRSPFARKKATA